jgi:RNA polymerase sigma-70 factor (ECF subfamily)
MTAELVARAQRGDRDAFSAIATAAVPRLHASARLILGHADRADDAVQDALVEAWRDLRGLRDPDRLDAWLHRLLVRACHRHAVRDRRDQILAGYGRLAESARADLRRGERDTGKPEVA